VSATIATADLLASLILQGLASVQAMVELQTKARAEGRDVTADELAALRSADMAVRADLDAAIAAHGGH
jgi:aryl carrier-like protein